MVKNLKLPNKVSQLINKENKDKHSYLIDEVKPENITVTDIRQYQYLTNMYQEELSDEDY